MSSVPEHVDVLVVGFGPVGAAIAGLLGRYGIRTLVIDKSPEIFLAPRAIALDNEALRILQMVGLADDAFAKFAIPHVRMHCPYVGEFARIDTSGTIDGHPKLVTFYQPELERVLRRLVESAPTVTARTGVELLSLEDDGHGVRAQVRSIASGATSTVHARYLVGADGARSVVRTAIGQDFKGATYSEDWLIVDALGVPSEFDHVEFLCDPARPTPHMVAPGGRTRWEFMLRAGEEPAKMESDESIAELLAPWAQSANVRIERKAVYRFHARSCDRYRAGRVFLAGDAAHVTPPFVGQGLVAGLRDAANLSWKLAWVVRGLASPEILESYDEERRPHAVKMIMLARAMGWLVMPRTRVSAVLAHGAIKALRRIPSFRALVDHLGVKPQNAYSKGLFVPGSSGELRRGSWFPQGVVRRDSGAVEWSDDVLGSGIALVGLGRSPAERLTPETRDAWSRAGGTIVELRSRGDARRGARALEDLDDCIVPGATRRGWCAVVRPDRTVLHEGPAEDAERLVRESLRVLGVVPAPRVELSGAAAE